MRWNWKMALEVCSVLLAVLFKLCTNQENETQP